MFYWTDYFLSLYREDNICKMVSLQWKDRATLRELAQHLLSETTTDEVMVSLYFRAIKFLLSKVNWSMYALNSTSILPYRTFSWLHPLGPFSFPSTFSLFLHPSHTPLSAHKGSCHSIYKFSFKRPKTPKFLPQMCLFVGVVPPFPLSFLSNPFKLPERVARQSGTGQSIPGGSGEAGGHEYFIAQIQ